MSRRWKNVNTGNVKDRANIYLKPDETEPYKSPVMQRKLLNSSSLPKKGPLRDGVKTIKEQVKDDMTNMTSSMRQSDCINDFGSNSRSFVSKSPSNFIHLPTTVNTTSKVAASRNLATEVVREVAQNVKQIETHELHQESGNEKEYDRQQQGADIVNKMYEKISTSQGIQSCHLENSENIVEDASDADDDTFGYEDEYSVGIDLPLATETTSGRTLYIS